MTKQTWNFPKTGDSRSENDGWSLVSTQHVGTYTPECYTYHKVGNMAR